MKIKEPVTTHPQPPVVLTPKEKADGWEIREAQGIRFKVLPYKAAIRKLLGTDP